MRRIFSLILPLFFVSLLAACGSQPPAAEQDGAGVGNLNPRDVTNPVNMGNDALNPSRLKDPKSILSKREIFFDLDSYTIRDEFRPLIEAHAKFLVANPSFKVLVQGNTDDRGSREYNLALGQKRAEAIKKALKLLGAREEQIEAVSLGKEKPRCTDSGESCWAQNRRGDLIYNNEY